MLRNHVNLEPSSDYHEVYCADYIRETCLSIFFWDLLAQQDNLLSQLASITINMLLSMAKEAVD